MWDGMIACACDPCQVEMCTPPTRWLVTLVDGAVVEIWAHSVAGLSEQDNGRDYVFGCLMDIRVADQEQFEISATAPPKRPERVEVVVARVPKPSVADILST